MKFTICVKPTPKREALAFDAERGRLKRDRLGLEMGRWDLAALDWALSLRRPGDLVNAIAMGPPRGRAALEQAVKRGADEAVLLSDQALAGSDALATAQALAGLIQGLQSDMVLCGEHSEDGRTGQVGPMLAAILGWHGVTAARTIEFSEDGRSVSVIRPGGDGEERVDVALPAVITVTSGPVNFAPAPTPPSAPAIAVRVVTAAQANISSAPSPSHVVSTDTVNAPRMAIVIPDEDRKAVAAAIKIALERKEPESQDEAATTVETTSHEGMDRAWVWCDPIGGPRQAVTAELLGEAQRLATAPGGQVAAFITGPVSDDTVRELAAAGADKVYAVASAEPHVMDAERSAQLLAEQVEVARPGLLLFPASVHGREIASRLAGQLRLGLLGDISDLEWDGDGRLVARKPVIGRLEAVLTVDTSPVLATAAQGLFHPLSQSRTQSAELVVLAPPPVTGVHVERLSPKSSDGPLPLLGRARVVVGMGIGVGEEGIPQVMEVARQFGFDFGITLSVSDEGWLSEEYHLGITGKAISPEIYVALGISGATEHMIGVRDAKVIIAVNTDEDAAIFQKADVGIVGDWQAVLPWLAPMLVDVAR